MFKVKFYQKRKYESYVGVYVGAKRVHKHMVYEEVDHNANLSRPSNTLTENNCQNSPQVSTHNRVNANMPHGSLLVGTPTTPITLN